MKRRPSERYGRSFQAQQAAISQVAQLSCSRFRRRAAKALAEIPGEVRYIAKTPAVGNFGNARLLRIPPPEISAARIQTHSKDVGAEGVGLPGKKSVELPDTDAGVLRDRLRRQLWISEVRCDELVNPIHYQGVIR